jgi:hypothetical protein
MQCSWEGCPFSAHLEHDLANHLDTHAGVAWTNWAPPSSCAWQGCKSKATFRRISSYESHLGNIHTRPLLCTAPKCKHKTPFRNEGDLNRHRSTARSSQRPYSCPFENCQEQIKTFARKDKWLKHIRETPHDGDQFCPYPHCVIQKRDDSTAFQTREGISWHLGRYHSSYESETILCALGTCALKTQSEHWTVDGIAKHLEKHHGITANATRISSMQQALHHWRTLFVVFES